MKILIAFLAMILIVCLFFFTCTAIVPFDRVGVRSNQLGDGVEKKDLTPGLWVIIPGIHKLDILDPTIQRLNFGVSEPNSMKNRRKYQSVEVSFGTSESALQLRTKDQYTTALDITIYYRIKDGKAHEALLSMGPGYSFRERFRQQAEAIIWKVMAEMRTEDFYDSKVRTDGALETTTRLNTSFEKDGVPLEAVSLLIRKVVFDPRFESKLITKQLLDQRKLLGESQTILENQKKVTEMIQRETGAKVAVITTEMTQGMNTLRDEAGAKISFIKADADLKVRIAISAAERHKREKTAEGEKLKEIAKAVGEKAINQAYQSSGGTLLLSRKMIQNLKIGNIIINTNKTNPFEVDTFLNMVGAQ